MSKEVILFYSAQLPSGSAGATRVVTLAKMIKAMGYHPMMLGINDKQDLCTKGRFQGVEYALLTLSELALTGWKALERERRVRKTLTQWLDEYRRTYGIELILVTEMQGYAGYLRQYSKMAGIPVAINIVEWYARTSFTGVFGPVRYLRHQWDVRVGYARMRNVIAISSMLERFYHKKGCNTIRIPTIVDMSLYPPQNRERENNLILAYAGVPWGKDAIENAIEAIALLSDQARARIELRLYGIYQEEAIANGKFSEKGAALLGHQVRCMGRIPQEQVCKEIQKADFTVLLRESTRKNTAGFPTKVGESMAAGVPVIANLTSDIGLYLQDGTEGLVCENETPEACGKALSRALELSDEERQRMRLAARKQAEKSFHYGQYLGEIQAFLDRAGMR